MPLYVVLDHVIGYRLRHEIGGLEIGIHHQIKVFGRLLQPMLRVDDSGTIDEYVNLAVLNIFSDPINQLMSISEVKQQILATDFFSYCLGLCFITPDYCHSGPTLYHLLGNGQSDSAGSTCYDCFLTAQDIATSLTTTAVLVLFWE